MYSSKNKKELEKLIDNFVLKEGYETFDLAIYYETEDTMDVCYALWEGDSYHFVKLPKEMYEDVDITIHGVVLIEEHKPDYIWEGGEKWTKKEDEGNQSPIPV